MTDAPRRKMLSTHGLRKVAPAEEFARQGEPALRIGDVVRLNSGGPASLVVDVAPEAVTVAWRGEHGVIEATMPPVCVHRVRQLW